MNALNLTRRIQDEYKTNTRRIQDECKMSKRWMPDECTASCRSSSGSSSGSRSSSRNSSSSSSSSRSSSSYITVFLEVRTPGRGSVGKVLGPLEDDVHLVPFKPSHTTSKVTQQVTQQSFYMIESLPAVGEQNHGRDPCPHLGIPHEGIGRVLQVTCHTTHTNIQVTKITPEFSRL